jgi:predicted RNase H-like HicB family nuclease
MGKIKFLVSWCDNNYSAIASGEHIGGTVIVTGKSLVELKQQCKESIDFHLEGLKADGDEIPVALQGEYTLDFELTTQALLRALEGKTTLTAIHRVTGINLKQLSHYAVGEKKPRPAQRAKIVNGIHRIARDLATVV